MSFVEKFKDKMETVKEFIRFLWEKKMWWMIPLVLLLLFIGTFIVIAQGSAFAPFIYALF